MLASRHPTSGRVTVPIMGRWHARSEMGQVLGGGSAFLGKGIQSEGGRGGGGGGGGGLLEMGGGGGGGLGWRGGGVSRWGSGDRHVLSSVIVAAILVSRNADFKEILE